jgi:hypothetical protein
MRRTTKSPGEKIVKDIKRRPRKHYSSEEKIRIVLDGLRGETSPSSGFLAFRAALFGREICSLVRPVYAAVGSVAKGAVRLSFVCFFRV